MASGVLSEGRFNWFLRAAFLPRLTGFAFFWVAFYVAYHYAMSFSQVCAAPFWFPDSVLLCALLLTPPRFWWVFILGALPIRLFSPVAQGNPIWFLLAMFAIDSAKGVAAAVLLRRFLKLPIRMETVRELGVFCLLVALVLPAAFRVFRRRGAACDRKRLLDGVGPVVHGRRHGAADCYAGDPLWVVWFTVGHEEAAAEKIRGSGFAVGGINRDEFAGIRHEHGFHERQGILLLLPGATPVLGGHPVWNAGGIRRFCDRHFLFRERRDPWPQLFLRNVRWGHCSLTAGVLVGENGATLPGGHIDSTEGERGTFPAGKRAAFSHDGGHRPGVHLDGRPRQAVHLLQSGLA